MVELWIEDRQVDLIGNENIQIDYAIAKIGEIQARTGARSAQFKLPKTANNRAIFENTDDVNSLSTIPYTKLKARLYVDGIDQNILFCTLENSTDTYNIRLYGTNADIFNQLKSVSLQDLNFCTYDHFWTRPNVATTRTNTDGFIYPIIDYNYDSPNAIMDNVQRDITASNMLPAVYYHTVFDAIASYFGITINNEVENTANYPLDMLLLPFSRKEYTRVRAPYRYETTFSASTDITLSDDVGPISIYVSPGVWIEFDTNEGCSDYWNHGNFDNYLQFAEQIRMTFEYNFNLEANPATVFADYPITIVLCNDILDVIEQDISTYGTKWVEENVTIPFGGSVNVTGEWTVTTSKNALLTGAYLSNDAFFMFHSGLALDVILKQGSYLKIKSIEILEDGEIEYSTSEAIKNFVTIGSALPDWDCANFIKQYCLKFGALIYHNSITNQLSIVPFKKVVDNINSFVDWSDKLDFNLDFDVSSIIGEYAQRNYLKYEEDNEVSKPSGTDYFFDIANENLQGEADIIQLDYAATQTVVRLVDIDIPQIKVFENDGTEFQGCETQRVLVNKYYDTADFANTSQLSYLDSAGTTNVTTDLPIPYFILVGEDFNLGFGNNLATTYYNVLEEILTNAKKCRLPIRLNASDINQFDGTKPIYIKHFNAYFYVSQINGYNPVTNETTMVELVKLF